MNPRSVIIRPIVSEKSYALLTANKYTFRVTGRPQDPDPQAVEEVFGRARCRTCAR
jgi:ribosomal protein L23